jgi:hypothetical protein
MKTIIDAIIKNPKTSLGALLALVGLGLFWSGIIDRDQFEGGMGIVVIYIGLVARDGSNRQLNQ